MIDQNIKSEKLSIDEIRKKLSTTVVGSDIVYSEKTGSTNKDSEKIIKEGSGSVHGTLVITDEQTSGRGRLDRSWMSAPFKNITMSVILSTGLQNRQNFFLTMIASIAAAAAIEKSTGLHPLIKWPNDIYIKNKKSTGILTEICVKDDIKYAVIGIGMNVNSDMSLYPDIGKNAVSLKQETGSHVSRERLICGILEGIESRYNKLNNSEFSVIRSEWEHYSMITGKEVHIINGDSTEAGIVESLAEDGSLIFLSENGTRKNIYAGDVSLRMK